MFIRSIKCSSCEVEVKEKVHGDGFKNWTQILGVTNTENILFTDPHLCPDCTKKYLLPFLNTILDKEKEHVLG